MHRKMVGFLEALKLLTTAPGFSQSCVICFTSTYLIAE